MNINNIQKPVSPVFVADNGDPIYDIAEDLNTKFSGSLQDLAAGEPLAWEIEEQLLTYNEALKLHEIMIATYGGTYEIENNELLKSILQAPYQTIFGEEIYPTVEDKAAKMLFDFSHYQVFKEGNKRMGLAASYALLAKNGKNFPLEERDPYDLIMLVATNRITDSAIVAQVLKGELKIRDIPKQLALENEVEPDI